MSSLVYLLAWSPPPHIPYISSLNQWLLFTTHAHAIATCFAVVPRLYDLFIPSLSLNSLLGTLSFIGTCESFFCVRIESRIESAVRFDFESAVYTTQAVTPSNELHRYLFCICQEREWRTQLSTCYSFQFSPKTRQTMPLYDYLTPKLDFKRKFNQRQSFLYKWRLTVRTIQNFRIGSSLRIESQIGSSIRNRIESRSFAGP